MTSLLEREPRWFAPLRGEHRGPAAPKPPFDVSAVGRMLLAVLSASAGVIHLVMVPSHYELSAAEGVGFAVAGWLQIVFALVLLSRPSRAVLLAAAVANAAAIGAWAFSRVWGLPFGPHAWHAEASSFLDLTAMGLEAAFLVAAGILWFRPGLGRGWDRTRLMLASVVPIAVLALTSAALASPSARDHAAGSHGAHGAAASGHAHGAAGAPALEGLDQLENGHQHGGGVVKLDTATQTALATQLARTAQLVERYPNIAAAEAAGYRRAGPFVPGLGTHYLRMGPGNGSDDTLQGVDGPMTPLLIFDGVKPDSPIAGFMYLSYGTAAKGGVPEGFIGPNDHWHFHTNTCVVFKDGQIEAPLGADADATPALCRKYGGSLIRNTGYMVHVWTVSGYESSRGTFSNINPAIACPDGTYYTIPLEKLGWRTSACRNTKAA